MVKATRKTLHKRAILARKSQLVTTVEAPEVEKHLDLVEVDNATGVIRVVHVIARRVNIARPVCSLLLGDNHPAKYRMATGVVIMAVGVIIAKVVGHMTGPLEYVGDLVGYAVHGLGLTPFIEHLAKGAKDRAK